MSQQSAATLVFRPRREAPALAFAVAVCCLVAALAPLLDLPRWGRLLWFAGAWVPLLPAIRNFRAAMAIRRCELDGAGGRLTLTKGEIVAVRIASWYAHPWLIVFVLRSVDGRRCWVVTAPRPLYPRRLHRRLRAVLRGSERP